LHLKNGNNIMTSIVVVMTIITIFTITGEANDIGPVFKKQFPQEGKYNLIAIIIHIITVFI